LLKEKMPYSGDMYPNIPTRRVRGDALPALVSFVNPKSATCTIKDSVQLCEKGLKWDTIIRKISIQPFP
jgi:hypothetical protein